MTAQSVASDETSTDDLLAAIRRITELNAMIRAGLARAASTEK